MFHCGTQLPYGNFFLNNPYIFYQKSFFDLYNQSYDFLGQIKLSNTDYLGSRI